MTDELHVSIAPSLCQGGSPHTLILRFRVHLEWKVKSRKANQAVKGEEGVKGRKRQDRKAQEIKEQRNGRDEPGVQIEGALEL